MINKYYYLQIYPTNDIEIVKKVYKILAKKYHPDKINDENNYFQIINDNYKYLIDNLYNYYNDIIIDNMYDDIDIHINIDVTMKDILNGLNMELSIDRKEYYFKDQNIFYNENNCKILLECNPFKINDKYDLKNNKMVINDKGNIFNQIHEKIQGDLILNFIFNEEDYEIINKSDLLTTVEISLYQSLFGFDITKKYIDNTNIYLSNINDDNTINIIDPYKLYKINQYGLYINKNRSDLYIKFKIIFPKKINDKNKQYLQQIFFNTNYENISKTKKKYNKLIETNIDINNININNNNFTLSI